MRLALVAVFFVSCAVVRPVTVPTPAAGAALTLGVDTHLHLTMSQAAKPAFRGEPGDGVLAHAAEQRLVNQVTEPQLRAAGARLVFGALWPPFRGGHALVALHLPAQLPFELFVPGHQLPHQRQHFVLLAGVQQLSQHRQHAAPALLPLGFAPSVAPSVATSSLS